MSELYERILGLCDEKGITITELCRQSGASRGSLTDLKMGRKSSLSTATLSKIAVYFGVSVDYLLGKTGSSAMNANDELEFHVGDSFVNGMITVSNVKKQKDGTLTVTYSIDQDGLSVDELMNALLLFKKAHEKIGIPPEQLLELAEQIARLSQVTRSTLKSPQESKESASEPASPTPEGKDTPEE